MLDSINYDLLLEAMVHQAKYDYVHKPRTSRAFSSARHFLRGGCWGMLDPTSYMPMLRQERYDYQLDVLWLRRYTHFDTATNIYKIARQYHINNDTIDYAEQERIKRIKRLERMKARYEKTKRQTEREESSTTTI